MGEILKDSFNNKLIERISDLLRSGSDLIIIILMILIIGVMVIPVPTWILDILLSLNIGISVCILISSFHLRRSVNISTFPSILLLTTLLRISLNISTTRLILLDGYAGRVINAFGNFVVAGNFAVGAVIFIIITVVQFIVIAKGAERVAEVSARFALDAMPGKQMSIDADMRAGIIDAEEAKKMRNELDKESQFYGAMDGAMKFIKGDVIAGIIITLINMVAGLLIGIVTKGMSLADAIRTYLILTVGDGLVSQIPALLISSSAGIIITRISSNNNEFLGKEILQQLFNQPRTLIITSIIMIVFALIPGLPFLSFFLLALVSGSGAFILNVKSDNLKNKEEKKVNKQIALNDFCVPIPILIEISSDLMKCFERDNETMVYAIMEKIREIIFQISGVYIPKIMLKENNLKDNYILRIYIKELPVFQMEGTSSKLFKSEGGENKENISGMDLVIKKDEIMILANEIFKENIVISEHARKIVLLLCHILNRHAYEFVGINEVQCIVNNLERLYPALVRNTVPKLINLVRLTDVLRRLVREGISIKDLKSILESLAEYGQAEMDTIMLTELVRAALGRSIALKYANYISINGYMHGTIVCYIIEPKLETILQEAIQTSPIGSYLALEPEFSSQFIQRSKELFGSKDEQIIIITQQEIRYFVRKILEIDIPDLVVLSYQELPADIIIQPLGKISF
mgnify:CR=1 FL=1